MIGTAILVDGGFYRKRARTNKGNISGEDRAKELFAYCMSHINTKGNSPEEKQSLYRIVTYAENIGIAPGILVGRMQREELIAHSMLNDLKEKYEIVGSD